MSGPFSDNISEPSDTVSSLDEAPAVDASSTCDASTISGQSKHTHIKRLNLDAEFTDEPMHSLPDRFGNFREKQ
jgi:hypothetical protein